MSSQVLRPVRWQSCSHSFSYPSPIPNQFLRRYAANKIAYKPLPGKTHPETVTSIAYGKKSSQTTKSAVTQKPKSSLKPSTPIKVNEKVDENVVTNHNPKINPPDSTIPPPLDVPERQPGQRTAPYWYSVGKSYLKFYKTALKNVWYNARQAKKMRKELVGSASYRKFLISTLTAYPPALSRADFQFIIRSHRDFAKLPYMVLVLMVCGEFTPLIIGFLTAIVPRTAWLPKQIAEARAKMEKRRSESFRQGTLLHGSESLKSVGLSQGTEVLSPAQILHISRTLGLHSAWWETLWDSPPVWLARSRVNLQLAYLEVDDSALHRDGRVSELSEEEVKLACDDRGIDVLKNTTENRRKDLERYMKWRMEKNVNVASLMMVRPSQYDQLGVTQV